MNGKSMLTMFVGLLAVSFALPASSSTSYGGATWFEMSGFFLEYRMPANGRIWATGGLLRDVSGDGKNRA
jgi:hypothetical protein